MEKGIIVKAIDGSYSVMICDNEIKDTGNICRGQQYIILATKCVLPSDNKREKNDVIMKDLDSGAILFIQERFLLPIHICNICPKCGKEIT